MIEERIVIRGTSAGLIIKMGAGDWDMLLQELDTRLSSTPSFFRGGRVALVVGRRKLADDELQKIGELLERHKVSLWAVEGEDPETQAASRNLGLEVQVDAQARLPMEGAVPGTDALPSPVEGTTGVLMRRTLRSGQAVRYHGHVVIIGDVNPGAEIVASGDVVVWGKLRGTVHAGAEGDESAVVCALHLAPTQLRIGSYIARSPEEAVQDTWLPEKAFVQGDRIVAEPWGGSG
jgi:septum site-determining protein MinC